MGASDPNPRKEDLTPAPRAPLAVTEQVPSLTRAAGVRIVGDRFDDLSVRDDPSSDLFQVMKAVEDAETTIKEQLEENNQLKEQLMQKTHELERVRLEAAFRSNPNQVNPESDPNSPVIRNGPSPGPSLTRNPESDPNSPVTRNGPSSGPSLSRSLVVRQNASGNNGISTRLSGEQADSADPSPRVSIPSSRSLSPTRNIKEGDNDSRFNSPSQGLVPVSGINPNQMWKQDLVAKVREHEEEIAQLRRHLADYSVKETQILNEKSILEQRIAYMRRAFDQQQQDLVDAASKALSYRQDIIEENIRLTYVLQAAQQERSTFVSSLLPLLSEYGLQPAVLDAQSIVGNLKILFRHLQEKLIITEEKLKESQYQIMPINADYSNNNNSNLPPRSPSHAKALVPTNTGSMEIVPQNIYGQSQSPMSSPSAQHRSDWDLVPAQHHQKAGPSQQESKSQQIVDPRNRFVESRRELSLSFKDLAVTGGLAETSNSDLEDSSVSDKWGPAQNSPNNNISNNSSNSNSNVGAGEDNASQPHLPTVMEEPSSSFSEAESDILPGIEGLRISGEPVPGRELQVSGYSIHGTTSCNFEWVRHHEDGSVNYIDGAKQPNYLVSADDVDAYLAIEVQPLDDRKRKGEVVTLFANDRKKITCDTETQDQIKKNLSVGHINFELELAARFMDIWEPTVLSVKRDGWSIKCSGPRGAVAQEKFQQATSINIRLGYPNEFTIRTDDDGEDFSLRTIENGMPRDTIVLTLRLFKMMAVEKRKVKKKGLFFK